MKTKNILIHSVLILACAGIYSFRLLNTAWTVNSKDAKIAFDMPNGKHNGTVGNLTSTFQFDPLDPAKSVLVASVDVGSIKTDAGDKLDGHLQSPDFFDAANHPKITFTSDSIMKTDSGFVAMGKLAMRDSIHAIKVPFSFVQDGNKAMFKGSMDLFAGDYGVGKKSPNGNDRVVISIEVPVIKE